MGRQMSSEIEKEEKKDGGNLLLKELEKRVKTTS